MLKFRSEFQLCLKFSTKKKQHKTNLNYLNITNLHEFLPSLSYLCIFTQLIRPLSILEIYFYFFI